MVGVKENTQLEISLDVSLLVTTLSYQCSLIDHAFPRCDVWLRSRLFFCLVNLIFFPSPQFLLPVALCSASSVDLFSIAQLMVAFY